MGLPEAEAMTLHAIHAMRDGFRERSNEDLVYQGVTIGSIVMVLAGLWLF